MSNIMESNQKFRGSLKEIRSQALNIASKHLESVCRLKESAKVNILAGKGFYDAERCTKLRNLELLILPKLWTSIQSGDVGGVEKLLKAHPMLIYALNPRHLSSAVPSLIYAADKNRLEVVKALLKAGADANAKHTFLGTALTIAASKNNNLEMVNVLLEYGAKVNVSNSNGETALTYSKSTEITRALLKAGADVNARSAYGTSALHAAAGWRGLKQLQELLKYGADVNSTDERGDTPLMCAVNSVSTYNWKNLDMIGELLKAGANPDLKNRYGETALMKATKLKSEDVIQELMKARTAKNNP